MNNESISFSTVMEYCGDFRKSYILFTAIELDLFSHLSKIESASGELICESMKLNKRTGIIFLNSLSALKLIEKDTDGNYRNSDTAQKYLTCSENDRRAIVRHFIDTLDAWKDLREIVKTGQSPNAIQDGIFGGDSRKTEDFIWGMDNIAKERIEELLREIPIKPTGKLLDLGGGPGTYGIGFCKKYPQISSVIYDLPIAIKQAKINILKNNMEERVKTVTGSAIEDSLGSGYQTIWCSQFIHCFSAEVNKNILKKCYSALLSGGEIIIHDFLLNDIETLPVMGALFSVQMTACTHGGKSYSRKEVCSWLEEVGFKGVEAKEINAVSAIASASKA